MNINLKNFLFYKFETIFNKSIYFHGMIYVQILLLYLLTIFQLNQLYQKIEFLIGENPSEGR